jgi:hypothetical protein
VEKNDAVISPVGADNDAMLARLEDALAQAFRQSRTVVVAYLEACSWRQHGG